MGQYTIHGWYGYSLNIQFSEDYVWTCLRSKKNQSLVDHNHYNLHLHDINFSCNIHLQGITWPNGKWNDLHKPRLPWNTGIYFTITTIWGEVVWGRHHFTRFIYISTTLQETTSNKSPWKIHHFGWYLPGFRCGFSFAKMLVSGRGYQGFPSFPNKILLPMDPPMTMTLTPDHHSIERGYPPSPAMPPGKRGGVVGQTSKNRLNIPPRGTYQKEDPESPTDLCFGIYEGIWGFRDAWGMLQGYVGGFLENQKRGHLFGMVN